MCLCYSGYMSNHHHHHHEPKKSKFDLLQEMRKPHGIAILALIVGAAGWAVWNFLLVH